MTRLTESTAIRLRAAAYIPPTQRRDNCGGCQYSKAQPCDGSLRCVVLMSQVSYGGHCTLWAPVVPVPKFQGVAA